MEGFTEGDRDKKTVYAETQITIQCSGWDMVKKQFKTLKHIIKHHESHGRVPPGVLDLVGLSPAAVDAIFAEKDSQRRDERSRTFEQTVSDIPSAPDGQLHMSSSSLAAIGGGTFTDTDES